MDLDKIAVELRPRTPYEATDLGFVLVRKFWRPLLIGWVVGTLPFFVGAALIAVFTPMFWLPLIGLWWLKPLFDRIALFVLSRGFFGDLPPLGRTLDYALRGWRSWSTFSDITWRRFYLWRSLAMPVRELEQLRGDQAGARIRLLLRREVRMPGVLLGVVGSAVELMFWAASILLIGMLIPEAVGVEIGEQFLALFGEGTLLKSFQVYLFSMYFICMSVVEVVYVAAGFGLYINRRVGLEGWDIELTFKRLARRLRKHSSAVGRAAILLVLGLGLGSGLSPSSSFAQSNQAETGVTASQGANSSNTNSSDTTEGQNRDGLQASSGEDASAAEPPFDAQAQIAAILEDPVFGHDATEKQWRIREGLFDNLDDSDDSPLSDSLIQSIAHGAEVIVWGIAVLAIGLALYFIIKYLRPPELSMPVRAPEPAPAPEFSKVEAQVRIALPDDIVAAAMAAWERGAKTESLSLLYRGTIRGLARGYRIEIDPSMTARQSVRMVRQAGGPADYIGELAAAWTQVVYAGREIDEAEAAGLFAAWKQHFSAAERPTSTSGDSMRLDRGTP